MNLLRIAARVAAVPSNELELALGWLELYVRHEGIESVNERDQIDQVAYEAGYAGKKLAPEMKILAKHFKVDIDKSYKNGQEDGQASRQ